MIMMTPLRLGIGEKKILLYSGLIGVVLLGVLIFSLAGGLPHLNHLDDNPTAEPRTILPLQWENDCPKVASTCPKSFQGIPPLILISLDGFNPDFMQYGFTPTIKKIAECGAHAPYMVPVFPSKTFPNHFSQVTGVYPSVHGIIDNNFYDPVKHKMFKVGQSDYLDPSWWLTEPIWITAEKLGKKAACYFWPGSEVEFKGVLPSYFKKYNSKAKFNSRVDQILSWLDLPPKSRPHFLTLYVNEPDHALHRFGRRAKQVNEALAMVDHMIERLFSGLQVRDLLNCVNLVIMSDHGMSDISCDQVINLQKFFAADRTFNSVGPFARIRPKGRKNSTFINELVSKLSCKESYMRAYAKENLPIKFHYSDNERIEPVFVDVDAGWTVVTREPTTEKDNDICTGGAHGYDNTFPDMKAMFVAHGPSFKKKFPVRPFLNIEVYEMLAELIDVPANPNNGTKGSMHYILNSPKTLPPQKIHASPPIADVPNEDTEYENRVSASQCSCLQKERQKQVEDIVVTQSTHLPFGTPYSPDEDLFLRLLYNDDYIAAFHSKYRIPLWTAFTLKAPVMYKKDALNCWLGDARVPPAESPYCEDIGLLEQENFVLSPLYPIDFHSLSDTSSFITNGIAKSFNYSNLVEEPLNKMLIKWAAETPGGLNVITGPAYNLLHNEVKPSSIELRKMYEKNGYLMVPTHIFLVVTRCKNEVDSLSSCKSSQLVSQGFLLPNSPFPLNCESPSDFLVKNSVRVVDIEKLTGLHFYTSLPIYDAIMLRTMLPQLSV